MPSSIVVPGSVCTVPAIQHPRRWTTQLTVLYLNASYIIVTNVLHPLLPDRNTTSATLRHDRISPSRTASVQDNNFLLRQPVQRHIGLLTLNKHLHLYNDKCISRYFFFVLCHIIMHFIFYYSVYKDAFYHLLINEYWIVLDFSWHRHQSSKMYPFQSINQSINQSGIFKVA